MRRIAVFLAALLLLSCSKPKVSDPIPPGYTIWCLTSSKCHSVKPAIVPYDKAKAINDLVNHQLIGKEEDPRYMNSHWHIGKPGETAWCTIYALTKQSYLPEGSTALEWVYISPTENHMILLINTDRGVYVADSLDQTFRQSSGYQILSHQQFGTGKWITD